MAHRDHDITLSNGQKIRLSVFTGRVLATHASQPEVWIGDGGAEIALPVDGTDRHVRRGERVSAVFAAAAGIRKPRLFATIRHDADEVRYVGEPLPEGIAANYLPSLARALAAATVAQLLLFAAWLNGTLPVPKPSPSVWVAVLVLWCLLDLLATHPSRRSALLQEVRGKVLAALGEAAGKHAPGSFPLAASEERHVLRRGELVR